MGKRKAEQALDWRRDSADVAHLVEPKTWPTYTMRIVVDMRIKNQSQKKVEGVKIRNVLILKTPLKSMI